jgi:hypothetical protein
LVPSTKSKHVPSFPELVSLGTKPYYYCCNTTPLRVGHLLSGFASGFRIEILSGLASVSGFILAKDSDIIVTIASIPLSGFVSGFRIEILSGLALVSGFILAKDSDIITTIASIPLSPELVLMAETFQKLYLQTTILLMSFRREQKSISNTHRSIKENYCPSGANLIEKETKQSF